MGNEDVMEDARKHILHILSCFYDFSHTIQNENTASTPFDIEQAMLNVPSSCLRWISHTIFQIYQGTGAEGAKQLKITRNIRNTQNSNTDHPIWHGMCYISH